MIDREDTLIQDLKALFNSLEAAIVTLEQSFLKSKKLLENYKDFKEMNLDELDKFEALCSRFSRVSDILVKEVFRLLDLLEVKEEGSLIDVLNRAEKRNLIESARDFRNLRALRNKISHEYVEEDLEKIYLDVIKFTPQLINAYYQAKKYFENLIRKLV